MTTPATPARQCLELAAAAASAMVARAVDHAVTSLQQEEQRSQTVARRQELADAWLELLRRRQDWSQRYGALLRTSQNAVPEKAAPRQPAGGDRFGGLSLVDDDSVSQAIDSARVLQLIAPRLEQPLAELNALMSTALGLATVQPERNPLRPEVFADSLRALMQPVTQPQWPAIWSRHLAAPFAAEIETLYRESLKVLQGAKLQAATYRVLPVASPAAAAAARPEGAAAAAAAPATGAGATQAGFGGLGNSHGHANAAGPVAAGTPAHSGTPAPTPALGGQAWADLSRYALSDELFQHFLYARTPPSTQELAPAYFQQVDTQLAAAAGKDSAFDLPYDFAAVQQARTLPPVERPHRAVTSDHTLDDTAWGRWAQPRERSLARGQLKKQAHQVGQVLGLEVVRKVVDQVGRDARLLAPVREAVVALEPALAKLALVAPRFLAQEDHAGRRLVERVAERSFRYNDEFAPEFQEFFAGVRSAFHALNDRQVENDTPFQSALQQLEARWTAEDIVEERGRQVAVDAVHFAEAREAEAGRIAWTLSQRADLDGVPAVVQDFLYGPWALVMAHARLTDPHKQVDPGGWNAVISDLLWSVKQQQTLREPARFIATVPGMLERLRGGIAMLGQEPSEYAPFFHALEKLHQPVLKLRARRRHSSAAPEPEAPHVDPALLSTERQQPKAHSGDPWLTPSEREAVGMEDEASSAPAPLDAARPEEVLAVLDGLRQGCWVDLFANGKWRRASLSWVSSRATLFMFVSRGGRPHSMTRRSLEKLVRDRLLRPVEGGAVVDRAIDALSHAARGDAPRTRARHSDRMQLEEHAHA